jgi:diguanylate cyclase (GGDEF)-like protein
VDPASSPGLAAIRGARVLVVAEPGDEDLRLLLKSLGMRVDGASGAAEAVGRLDEHEYDLVLFGAQHGGSDVAATRVVEAAAHARHVPVATAPRRTPGAHALAQRGAHAGVDAAELTALLLTWISPRDAWFARSARRSAALAALALPADLPGFDVGGALERLGGNATILARLLHEFAAEHGTAAGEIVQAVRGDREGDARALLHRLKGAARIVGASRIAEAVAAAEAAIGSAPADAALAALATDLADAAVAIRRSVLPPFEAPEGNPAPRPQEPRPHVLAVDDEPLNLQTIIALLEPEFRISVASDGATALELAQRPDAPDLILLDIMMPGMTGYEVCRRLKDDETTRDIPVAFVTSIDDARAETRGLELGAIDYIVKPFNGAVTLARVRTHVRLRIAQRRLAQLSELDGLTGIANRRRFDQAFATEWKRAARYGTPLALVMVDLDFFKLLNDRYGHPAGDECLQRVAGAVTAALRRPTDLAARVGGEEFAALLADTEFDGALQVAREIAESVRSLDIAHASSPHRRATVSCGVAVMRPRDGVAHLELLERADRALYRAKEAGRDRVSA